MRRWSRVLACGIFTACIATVATHAAADVQPVATPLGGSYLLSEAPSQWQVAVGGREQVAAEVSVHDIDGVAIYRAPIARMAAGGSTFTVPALPPGFYRMSVREDRQLQANSTSFVVQSSIAIALDKRFGIDAALSWHGGDDRDVARAISLIRAAGLGSVRDRLRWSQVNPTKGVYEWGRFRGTAQKVSAAGLSSVTVFHDAPAWTRPQDPTRSGDRRPPQDMQAAMSFGAALARDMGRYLDAVEFWNEQNSDFFVGTPWQYAAGLKAFYLGVKSVRPQLKVLIGAASGEPGEFFRGIYANDVQRSFDVRNQHYYADPDKLLDFVATQVDPLETTAGVAGRPGWLTETGLGVKVSAGVATERSERDQAVHLVKAYMTGMAAGYERVFYFFLRELTEEGRNNWGILNRDFSPRLAYAAAGSLVRHIGGRPLAGYRRDSGAMTVYFGDQHSGIVAVAWGRDAMATRWGAEVSLADMFGRTLDRRRAVGGDPVLISNIPALPAGLVLVQPAKPWTANPLSGALTLDLKDDASGDVMASHVLELPVVVGRDVKIKGSVLPGPSATTSNVSVECLTSEGLTSLRPRQTVMLQPPEPTPFECDYTLSLRQGQRGDVRAVVALDTGNDSGTLRLVAVPGRRSADQPGQISALSSLCLQWRTRSAFIVDAKIELTQSPSTPCKDGFTVTAQLLAPGDGWVFPIAEVPSGGHGIDGVEFISAPVAGLSYPNKPLLIQLVDKAGAIWVLPLITRRLPNNQFQHTGLFASATLAPWSSRKSDGSFGTAELKQISIGYAGGGTNPDDKTAFAVSNLRALTR